MTIEQIREALTGVSDALGMSAGVGGFGFDMSTLEGAVDELEALRAWRRRMIPVLIKLLAGYDAIGLPCEVRDSQWNTTCLGYIHAADCPITAALTLLTEAANLEA